MKDKSLTNKLHYMYEILRLTRYCEKHNDVHSEETKDAIIMYSDLIATNLHILFPDYRDNKI